MDEDKSQLKDKLSAKNQDHSLPQDEVAIDKEIEELKQALKKQEDKYLRLLAEMENVRKRMQKEKHDTTRFAVENVIREFLMPLDNFENAMSFVGQTSEETQNWAKGFEMILTQFKEILLNHKVTPFESKGKAFDPHLHEVIEVEETENHQAGIVTQEFLRGYKCGDRILRAARVKIAKSSLDKGAIESNQQEKTTDHQNQEGED
ncbi:MAG: nucleotide exchange factor GrpE [Chlamydiota bacterium]